MSAHICSGNFQNNKWILCEASFQDCLIVVMKLLKFYSNEPIKYSNWRQYARIFNLKSRLCDFRNLNKNKKKSYLNIYLCDKNLLARSVGWIFREKWPNVLECIWNKKFPNKIPIHYSYVTMYFPCKKIKILTIHANLKQIQIRYW